ncbi:MAG TPA: GlsB/YeaQ/YmgE family stress response membrane protein [Actinomycetota bacterium]
MDIVGLLIMGLIVGAIGRLVVPGRHRLGFFGTMAVGVAGAFLGWWIGKGMVGDRYHLHPWIWAIIGSILVVLVVSALTRGRSGRPLSGRW